MAQKPKNFIQKLFNTNNAKSHLTHSSFMGGAFAPPDMKTRDQLFAYHQWVYAAAKSIAEEVATIELQLFKLKGGKVEEVLEHDLLSLLFQVNPYQSKFDFLFLLQLYKELTGEAFIYLERGKGAAPTSPVRELWLLRPDLIDVVPDPDTFIKGYIYRTGVNNNALAANEVIQHKYPSPTNPYRGFSPVAAAAFAVDTHKFAAEHNRNFFYNSARPDAILETTEPLSDEQYERLRHEWHTTFGGRGNNNKAALMESGVKYQQIALSPKDMDFMLQMNMTRDEILAVYKVPKSILGLTEDANRANAESADFVFANRTIKPKMQQLVDTLNEFYVPLWGEDLYLDFKDPTPENRDQTINEYKFGHNRWLTTNEIRQQEGLDPVEGGDVFGLPDNTGLGTALRVAELPQSKQKKKNIAKTLKARSDKVRSKEDIHRTLKQIQEKKVAEKRGKDVDDVEKLRAEMTHEIAEKEVQLEYAEAALKKSNTDNEQLKIDKEAAEDLAAQAAGIENHADTKRKTKN